MFTFMYVYTHTHISHLPNPTKFLKTSKEHRLRTTDPHPSFYENGIPSMMALAEHHGTYLSILLMGPCGFPGGPIRAWSSCHWELEARNVHLGSLIHLPSGATDDEAFPNPFKWIRLGLLWEIITTIGATYKIRQSPWVPKRSAFILAGTLLTKPPPKLSVVDKTQEKRKVRRSRKTSLIFLWGLKRLSQGGARAWPCPSPALYSLADVCEHWNVGQASGSSPFSLTVSGFGLNDLAAFTDPQGSATAFSPPTKPLLRRDW